MKTKVAITLDSIVAQSEGQVSTEIDEETVLMSIEKGSYYSMNNNLSCVWALIIIPIKVSGLIDKLQEMYDVSRDICEKDVLKVLAELTKENLITITE